MPLGPVPVSKTMFEPLLKYDKHGRDVHVIFRTVASRSYNMHSAETRNVAPSERQTSYL